VISIRASVSDGVIQLQEGLPVSGTVNPGVYNYYSFVVETAENYTFSASAVTSDPDMYVSNDPFRNGSNSRPTSSQNMWSSITLGSELVLITPTDPFVAACPLPCTYYVGMTGFMRAAAYELVVVRPSSTLYPLLSNGVPQRGHLPPGNFTYFRFHADDLSGYAQLLVTPLSGSVSVRSELLVT
jgi:hypothetical protein